MIGGWASPLKNHGVKVSWDEDIPSNEWKVIQDSMVPVTTNQSLLHGFWWFTLC